MENLKGKSMDLTEDNLNKLKELFPEVFEEGKIDFEKLRLVLGDEVDDNEERYEFTWHGKNNAIRIAQTPSTGTLRPDKESSKNWDNTENLYIEGDNLEVLKLLQKSYFGKVKMIYIDPPYNTGNDFVYKDDFRDNIANYKEITNQSTKANPETNGRYHTDWLNMMYPRLKLARNLLREDGVIFISIDDNEVSNLRKICDEVFGEGNFIGNFIWRGGRRNAAKVISTSHEYMIAFSKNMSYCMENNILWREKKKGLNKIYSKVSSLLKENDNDYDIVSQELKNWYKTLPDEDESKLSEHYCWVDSKGVYFASDISRGGGGGPKWNIVNPNTGELVKPPARGYAYSNLDELELDIKNGLIHFNGSSVPCKKRYLKDNEVQLIETVFYKDRRGSSKRLRSLMGGNIFDFPKDENILCDKIESFTSLSEDDIVLDFFSGSSTTAHALINLNLKDNGNRKFIMVQLPELTDEKSEAHKAGYKNICEIGKERIRRAGDKIVSENKDKEGIENLDIGFKVFKLDSSNLKSWDSSMDNLEQNLLDMVSNLKQDRTNEDLLYEILLKSGVELTAKIEEIKVGYNTLYNIGCGALLVCLDDKITQDVIDEIPKHKSPFMDTKVIFKEAGFMSDAAKINAVQNLKQFKIEDVRSV
ncbi:site-specific DNA-methyltransferase [Intestinibacter bartlettii]|uniref:site-specific DNA-methyltransferase n=1 Tax=Intestinibacter bartlettii TaxID=261299 RepID=UPI00321BFC83